MSGKVSTEHDERAEDGKHDHSHDSTDDCVVDLLWGPFTRPGIWNTGKGTSINKKKKWEGLNEASVCVRNIDLKLSKSAEEDPHTDTVIHAVLSSHLMRVWYGKQR